MWNDWTAGKRHLFLQAYNKRREQWTQPQIELLHEDIGTRRFELICEDLHRTPSPSVFFSVYTAI